MVLEQIEAILVSSHLPSDLLRAKEDLSVKLPGCAILGRIGPASLIQFPCSPEMGHGARQGPLRFALDRPHYEVSSDRLRIRLQQRLGLSTRRQELPSGIEFVDLTLRFGSPLPIRGLRLGRLRGDLRGQADHGGQREDSTCDAARR
jgi:hypothetical protein